MDKVEIVLKNENINISNIDQNIINNINELYNNPRDFNIFIESLKFINKPAKIKPTFTKVFIEYNGKGVILSDKIFILWNNIKKTAGFNNVNIDEKSDYKELPYELKNKLNNKILHDYINIPKSLHEKFNFTLGNNIENFDEIMQKNIDNLLYKIQNLKNNGEIFQRFRIEDKLINQISPKNTLIINANTVTKLFKNNGFPNPELNSWLTPIIGFRIIKTNNKVDYFTYYGFESSNDTTAVEARNSFSTLEKGKSIIKINQYNIYDNIKHLQFWKILKQIYNETKKHNIYAELVCRYDFDIKNQIQNILNQDIKHISNLVLNYIRY